MSRIGRAPVSVAAGRSGAIAGCSTASPAGLAAGLRTAPGRRIALGVGLLLVGFSGCTTRDPLNPLDPDNPRTRGAPEWLTALADDRAVDLAWTVPYFRDLASVRLVDASAETVLAGAREGAGAFRDAPLENGAGRRYRLELVLEDGDVLALPEASATPGPEAVWVFDSGSGDLLRLSPDAGGVRARFFHPSGSGVAVDPVSGSALLTEFYAGRVRLVSRGDSTRWVNDAFAGPLAALRHDGSWWVLDGQAGAIVVVDDMGSIVDADSSLARPVDLAPAGPGAVWIADRSGAVVLYRRGEGVGVSDSTALDPIALAPAGDGGVWVADYAGQALLRLDAQAEVAFRVEDRPRLVALVADPIEPGGVWAADRAAKALVRFDASGLERERLEGLDSPASFAISPGGDRIWVADPGAGAVLRLAAAGQVLGRVPLTFPVSIAVAFAPGPAGLPVGLVSPGTGTAGAAPRIASRAP